MNLLTQYPVMSYADTLLPLFANFKNKNSNHPSPKVVAYNTRSAEFTAWSSYHLGSVSLGSQPGY